jgi:hypothetical protein
MGDLAEGGAPAELVGPPKGKGTGLGRALAKIFSFPLFLAVAVAAGGAALTIWENAPIIAGRLFVEGDTWWHTAVGERILSTRTWPTTDLYSFTVHGSPWIAYEWLGEVVMAVAARLGGIQGLAVLLVLLAILIALLTYAYAWLRSGSAQAAALATLLALLVAPSSFTMRPQLLGYSLLLITLICLEGFQQGHSKVLWILPGLFLIWVNTHGSFVLGFAALGACWLGGLVDIRSGSLAARRWTSDERGRLLWASLLSSLAILITPYGTRLARYPLDVMLRQPSTILFAIEWHPLNFGAPFARVFLVLLLGAFVVQVFLPVIFRLDVLLLLLFAIVESCLHVRFLIFFAIVFAPVLASLLARWLPPYRREKDRAVVNAVLMAGLVGGMLFLFPSRARLEDTEARFYPVGAVRFMRGYSVPLPMFNDDNWGSYLIWALPTHRVFIDGRFDIYEYGGVLTDCYNFITLRGNPEAFLEKYGFRSALVRPRDAIEGYFEASPNWTRLYQDSTSIIFRRVGGAPPSAVGTNLNRKRRNPAEPDCPPALDSCRSASPGRLSREIFEDNAQR